jgi:hypothetical protein
MKITLAQWLEIDNKRHAAKAALRDLELTMCKMALGFAADEPERLFLLDLAQRLCPEIVVSDTCPQSEWMGGPTEGPGSEHTKTYMREPYVASLGSARRYFTAVEVQEAKDAGLLKGGPDLTGPLTESSVT